MNRPVRIDTVFADAWIDVYEAGAEGYSRYYCSGAFQDTTESIYYVLHADGVEKRNGALVKMTDNPYFMDVSVPSKIRFALNGSASPVFKDLFSEELPFWIEPKRKRKAK